VSIEKRVSAGLMLGIALALLAGCVDKSNPDMIDKRSVERWEFLVAHQADKAYDFLTPGYRATQTRASYAASMNNRPVQWTGARFKDKTCDGDRCTVNVDVRYSIVMPGMAGRKVENENTQTETWVRVKGEWYFLPN